MNNFYKMLNFLVLTALFSCAIAGDILCPDGKVSCPEGKACCLAGGKFTCCDTTGNDAESKRHVPEDQNEDNSNSFVNKVFPGIIPVPSNSSRQKRSTECTLVQHYCEAGDHCCGAAFSCCGSTCCAATIPCCEGYRCCAATGTCCGDGCCTAAQTCCPGTNVCCNAAFKCCADGCCPI